MEGIFTKTHEVEELLLHSTLPGELKQINCDARIVGTEGRIGNRKEVWGIAGIGKKWLWYSIVIVLAWFAGTPSFHEPHSPVGALICWVMDLSGSGGSFESALLAVQSTVRGGQKLIDGLTVLREYRCPCI